jgi:isoleucyl-tRNA synthetase
MSKSLQNYPDPMALVARQGADSMRFYLLSSPIIKGEDLNFSEKEVQELQRKNISRLHNVLTLYELYADGTTASDKSEHVLDRWITARMHQVRSEVTAGFENYELDRASRPITEFIDDLSVWYVRRSRERLKSEAAAIRTSALQTLRYVLRELALVMAPVMPFYAEFLWQRVKHKETDAVSVHLGRWPEATEYDTAVLAEMQRTREIVTSALEARTKAGLKVRQPIASVTGPVLPAELSSIVLDELNAKAYLNADEVTVDTALTPELRAEGAVRELMRSVQDMRKAAGLSPKDRVRLTVETTEPGQVAIDTHAEEVQRTVGADSLTFGMVTNGTKVHAGEFTFMVELSHE